MSESASPGDSPVAVSGLRVPARSRWLVRALWRGLLACVVFGLGLLTGHFALPPAANAAGLAADAGPAYYMPISSRQLTVTLQPLVPSSAIEAQLDRTNLDTMTAARDLALSPASLSDLAANLAELYPFSYVVAAQPLTLPDTLFDAKRQQYNTTATLDWLKSQAASSSFRTVGVTYADVYSKEYNFLFGEAKFAGPVCFASTQRMVQELAGAKLTPAQRWHHVVRHELGHTLGLQHVHDQHSVMAFPNSLQDLDKQGMDLTPADWKLIRLAHPILWK